ncbi:MAG: 50S ribosomal protein L19 [Candidatus Eisenbacteria bacterium]|uniref:Large ribosomal subunit protein bL19 n=1 Tax=Eiseniibacteriota bacterium TaxID=2212470 RepID=A0A937XDJ2_UNCEI|nr:50S ribosomal protein L19 [Candidatus Eisenbacteria bacterium]
MEVLRNIEARQLKAEIPGFAPGDTVQVAVRVVEGEKVRSQLFQGVVVARNNSGLRETVTVRKISDGVAVERIFPIHSPNVTAIEVVRHGRVRRAKLTYLRGRKGKSARIRERSQDQGRAPRGAAQRGRAPQAKPEAGPGEA